MTSLVHSFPVCRIRTQVLTVSFPFRIAEIAPVIFIFSISVVLLLLIELFFSEIAPQEYIKNKRQPDGHLYIL